jgi:hypothetical protein
LVHVSREYLFLLPYTRNDDWMRREQRAVGRGEKAKTTRNDDWTRREQRTEIREQWGDAKIMKRRETMRRGDTDGEKCQNDEER